MKDGARNGRQYAVEFGKERIPFTLEFRDRRKLAISVYPDRRVVVSAPAGRAVAEVLGRVHRRRAWIAKQRAYFARFYPLPTPPLFVSGATHLYLGRQYRLKLVNSERETVKMIGRFLYVYLANREDGRRAAELLDAWYRAHAKHVFSGRLQFCLESAPSLKLARAQPMIRKMVKRWGSCTTKGNILLNAELIKAPVQCIDYVIIHELCHLRAHNHGPEFQRLLARSMPDWRKRKERLEHLSF